MKNNLAKKLSSNIVLFVNNDKIAIFWGRFGPKLGDFYKMLVIMLLLSKAPTPLIRAMDADNHIKKLSAKKITVIVKKGQNLHFRPQFGPKIGL